MSEAHVLLIDDSLFVRSAVKKTLELLPQVADVLAVSNGEIGLAKIRENAPDLVILDLHMPKKSGFEVLETLREENSGIPVIVFSGTEERGAAGAIRAMELGAVEFVPKVPTGGTMDLLLEKTVPILDRINQPKKVTSEPVIPAATKTDPIDIVVIGASTGGPNALIEVVKCLPDTLGVPVLIVQHMPPVFTQQFAARMDRCSDLSVSEAQNGEALVAGGAWIAPGDFHMVVEGSPAAPKIRLNQDAKENFCRPAVDPLFRSVANLYGKNCLAVILTGMGSDGLNGCQVLHGTGARIISQDQASCVVWGMPRYVEEAEITDAVLPLNEIGPTISRWVRDSRAGVATSASAGKKAPDALLVDDSRAMRSMMRRVLEDIGLSVVEAGHGAEALQVLSELSVYPKVALVDWNMPEMDGMEFLERMKAKKAYKDIRTVIVSSETEADRVGHALENGADEYVMKPFTREALIEKLMLLGILGKRGVVDGHS